MRNINPPHHHKWDGLRLDITLEDLYDILKDPIYTGWRQVATLDPWTCRFKYGYDDNMFTVHFPGPPPFDLTYVPF